MKDIKLEMALTTAHEAMSKLTLMKAMDGMEKGKGGKKGKKGGGGITNDAAHFFERRRCMLPHACLLYTSDAADE